MHYGPITQAFIWLQILHHIILRMVSIVPCLWSWKFHPWEFSLKDLLMMTLILTNISIIWMDWWVSTKCTQTPSIVSKIFISPIQLKCYFSYFISRWSSSLQEPTKCKHTPRQKRSLVLIGWVLTPPPFMVLMLTTYLQWMINP